MKKSHYAVAVALSGACFISPASHAITINVFDKQSEKSVNQATVTLNQQSTRVNSQGQAVFTTNDDQATLTVAYTSGNVMRLQTLHNIPVNKDINVYLDNAHAVTKVAEFSFSVPFGQVPKDVDFSGLLPQLSYEFAGINAAHFGNISLYEDQLQDDGKISLVVVGYNDEKLPHKYGYILDQDPAQLELSSPRLSGPDATPMTQTAKLLQWKKLADPINVQSAETPCGFSEPPYNECGMFPPKRGVFSWVNIKRKGQLYHTPGAFSPARVRGANPTIDLPDSTIELAAHDDPLGFFPYNYSRHSFKRFTSVPDTTIDVKMPNVIIGTINHLGRDSFTVKHDSEAVSIKWQINAGNDDLSDVKAIDYGELELAWFDDKHKQAVVWRHRFPTQAGSNMIEVTQNQLPQNIQFPAADAKFANIQIWLYGSEGVDGYPAALKLWQANEEVMMKGDSAFKITRWK
ncbi:hypothetical protein ACFL2V_14230 [Pseudomonadota bacterium]